MRYIERDLPIEGLNAISEKEGNSKKPIYQIHKWWARRLGSVFRMLILAAFTEWDDSLSPEENQRRLWNRFYSRNELKNKEGRPPIILDPFMGGGTTVVEALRLGCKVIGIDLNPVAWFVTKKEIDPIDFEALDVAFKHLEKTVAPRSKRYYRTTCPKGHEADIMYVFWVKKVPCLACGEEVRLFPSFRIATRNGKHTVFCPHCYYIKSNVDSLDSPVECPECGAEYVPEEGYSGGGKYTCPACGQKENILKAVQRREGPPEAEMFALEYYCKVCGRGYKGVTGSDKALYEEARAEFQRLKDGLLFPRQAVPEGLKTRELLNHGYKYFYQMFNERQLPCLSLLLEEILKIKDENTREYMLLAFSDMLDHHNTFCNYLFERQHHEPLFTRHDYHVKSFYVEGNVWGTKLGRSTFIKTVEKLKKAKQYQLKPYERTATGDNKLTHDGFQALLAEDPDFVVGGQRDGVLRAQTAEDLSFLLNDKQAQKVDAVITDPPYCDNVMYSELADFYHVWLRVGLKNTYECFATETSPKAREIVKNVARHDGSPKPGEAEKAAQQFFFAGLTRCFKEAHRALRDDGIFAFTFHHKEPWAWKGVLSSIVEAGFWVTSVYPIKSEGRTGVLMEAGNIKYDIPFVCRKRLEEPKRVA
jgi:adenine-specific DNA methylase